MEPKKQQIKKWTKALRSGKYSQTQGMLQDETGFCCLGVACELFIPKANQDTDCGVLVGATPIDQSAAPPWLREINYQFGELTYSRLSTLNDNEGFSFDEIADVLEAVYIHEVLK